MNLDAEGEAVIILQYIEDYKSLFLVTETLITRWRIYHVA